MNAIVTAPTSSIEYPMLHGPDRLELFMALTEPKHLVCRKVEFVVDFGHGANVQYTMQVNSIQVMEENSRFWNIEGVATPVEDARGTALARSLQNPHFKPFKIERHRAFLRYHSLGRNGHIKFLS